MKTNDRKTEVNEEDEENTKIRKTEMKHNYKIVSKNLMLR